MTDKILIFVAWLTVGVSFASLFSLIAKFSPGLRIPFLLLLGAAILTSATVGIFAPSTRSWLAIIAVIISIGGIFAWLL